MNGYFEVKVHGEYFAQVGDKRELRGYEATFRLPNADKPLSIIAGKLLLPFLQKKDPQCFDYYTHFIDEIQCHGRKLEPNEIPIKFQSKDQLKEYIKFHQLSIDVDDYADLGKLRDHVRLAKEEPESFVVAAKKHKDKMESENALFALNADVLITTNKPVPVHEGGAPTTKHVTVEAPVEAPEPVSVQPKKRRGRKSVVKEENVSPTSSGISDAEELLS